jgi:hypothetical protein
MYLSDLMGDRYFKVCTLGDEKTNPEIAELLIAYGQAMWAWTRAESFLFLIFADAVEPRTNNHSKALRAAYFSVVSPIGRLDMINAVMNATEHPAHNDWKPLYKECRRELAVRGKLAHLVGHSYERTRGKPHAVLMDPIWHPNTKKTHGEANALPFTTKSLTDLAAKWELLNQRLHVFRMLQKTMMGQLKSSQKADAELEAHLRASLADPDTPTHQKSSKPSRPSSRKVRGG